MVPKGWTDGRVEDLLNGLESGVSVNGEDRKLLDGEKGVLRVSAVTYGTFNPHAVKVIEREDELDRAKINPRKSQIIISRSNTESLVGASAYINSDYPELFLPDKLWQTIPKPDANMKWLSYVLSSEPVRYTLSNLATGTSGSMKNITKGEFLNLKIGIPPLPEQQKIAKILFTWDKAISTTEHLIDNSTQQKKALMQQLLTGKKRLLDDEGKRFEGEWEEVTIGSTSKCFSGGTPSRSKEEYYGGKIPWITSGKLNDRFVYSVNEYITELGVENSSAKLVKKESILIAMYGATAGRVAVNMLDGATVNQAVLALEPKKNFHKLFLFYLFEVEMVKALQLVQGGQPNLSASIIKSIKVRIPILSEQQKIATVLTNADQEIELLEQQLANLQQEKKALMQVLLTGKVRVLVDGKVA